MTVRVVGNGIIFIFNQLKDINLVIALLTENAFFDGLLLFYGRLVILYRRDFFVSILIFGRSIFLFLGDNFTKYVDILRDLFIFLLILFLHFCLFS
jgi:hypothetical protein